MSEIPMLERLKERKLVQWGAAYLAGAWVLLQVLGELRDTYAWPSVILRVVTALVGVGFFAVLILAWYHGEKGQQRASGPELVMMAALLVIAGVAVAWLGGDVGPAGSDRDAPGAAQTALAPAAPVGEGKSIAVLPFTNLSADPENEYFSDGITEDILTNLSRIGGLKVISRTSAMQYKDAKKPLRQIGQELGVAHIVEGSVRRAGNRVRITAQLINARTDEHLWAQSYDRQLTDIFAIQSEIAEQIAGALQARLSQADRSRLATAPTRDVEAYQLYLKGRFLWNKQNAQDRARALAFYQQALARDSSYALVYAGLADLYADMADEPAQAPEERQKRWDRAKSFARKALQLDPTLAVAHNALGYVYHWYDWDFPAAEREFRRAVELDPAYAVGHHDYGRFLTHMGRFDEGIAQLRQAVELDPLTPWMGAGLAQALMAARRPDEAMRAAKASVEVEPEALWGHGMLAWAYLEKGMLAEAIAEQRAEIALAPEVPEPRAVLAYTHARAGQTAEARKLLAELEASEAVRLDPPSFSIALVYAALGDRDAAFRWLERARKERHTDIARLKVDPRLDPLRSDPRFGALLRKVGFP